MTCDFPQEVTAHMKRAREALDAARILCDAGLLDDAASRAYYAAFHAASATLMQRGLTFTKHSSLIGAVHKHLVNSGMITVEAGRWLRWLFELRSLGDYGEISHVEEDQARLALERAETLIQAFDALLKRG